MYEIVTTPTFKLCLDRLIHFLEIKYSPKKAQNTKLHIKNILVKNLSQNPHFAPISNRLLEIGIRDYRQYAVDEHNMVFYRINENKKQSGPFISSYSKSTQSHPESSTPGSNARCSSARYTQTGSRMSLRESGMTGGDESATDLTAK